MAICRGCQTVWFQTLLTFYTSLYGAKQTLTDNKNNSDPNKRLFTLTDTDGTTYQFYDFNQTANPQGAFYESKTPAGAKVMAYYNSDGTIREMDYYAAGSSQPYKELVYGYTVPGGNITSVTLEGLASSTATSLTPIREQDYIYYDGIHNTAFGSAGDLEEVVTYEQWTAPGVGHNGFVDVNPATYYFRYYTASSQATSLSGFCSPTPTRLLS